MADRDVVAEIDDIERYLSELQAGEDLPGREANRQALKVVSEDFRRVAAGVVGLEAEYSKGVTHEMRVKASMGVPDDGSTADKQEIARLKAELAAARGEQADGQV